jgi:hypothetical protein
MKINLHIINDVIYRHVKFQYEILCIMGYTNVILVSAAKIYYRRENIRTHIYKFVISI